MTPDPDAPAACGCHGASKGLAERSLMAHFLFHTFQIFFMAKYGEEHDNHSSILAWDIPRTEEPGGLQSIGS